jgi:hypothetical protein
MTSYSGFLVQSGLRRFLSTAKFSNWLINTHKVVTHLWAVKLAKRSETRYTMAARWAGPRPRSNTRTQFHPPTAMTVKWGQVLPHRSSLCRSVATVPILLRLLPLWRLLRRKYNLALAFQLRICEIIYCKYASCSRSQGSNLGPKIDYSERDFSRYPGCGQSRYSDWLWAGRPRVRSSSHGRAKNFHFSISSKPALGSTQPPI